VLVYIDVLGIGSGRHDPRDDQRRVELERKDFRD
jgi:hypothetical protein